MNDFDKVQVYKIIPDYESLKTIQQLKQTIKNLKNKNRRLKRNLLKYKANIHSLEQIYKFLDDILT